MSNRAQECRQRALQWEQAATVATDPASQEIYTEIVRQWLDMADYFDEIERGSAGRPSASGAIIRFR